jgi:hypothetical protein
MNRAPTASGPEPRDLRRGLRDQEKPQVPDDPAKAHLLPSWKTSAATHLDVGWPVPGESPSPAGQATIALMRRLVVHHPEAILASVLIHQRGKPVVSASFTSVRDANRRQYWNIPRHQAPTQWPTVGTAAGPLGPANSAPRVGGQIHRGRANYSVCSVADMTIGEPPPALLSVPEAIQRFGVSQPANLQRVKPEDLTAARTGRSKHKTLHLRMLTEQSATFWQPSTARV